MTTVEKFKPRNLKDLYGLRRRWFRRQDCARHQAGERYSTQSNVLKGEDKPDTCSIVQEYGTAASDRSM